MAVKINEKPSFKKEKKKESHGKAVIYLYLGN